jgi:hypothetical protein
MRFATSAVGPAFFETFDRPIVSGRAFHGGDWTPAARTAIVNETFARHFASSGGTASPIGARLRYSDGVEGADPWFEIVGVVRDLGLDPGEQGDEPAFVYHPAAAGTVSDLVMSVRVRGNPADLAARLPVIAADVDAGLSVRRAQPLDEWIRRGDMNLATLAAVGAGATLLVLFLSALGVFSLTSVAVSRRTREIGLRTALGANPGRVLGSILARSVLLMCSGITVGGALLMLFIAVGGGPTGRPEKDAPIFGGYLAVTAAVMLTACLLACVAPARRALRINPTEALREA